MLFRSRRSAMMRPVRVCGLWFTLFGSTVGHGGGRSSLLVHTLNQLMLPQSLYLRVADGKKRKTASRDPRVASLPRLVLPLPPHFVVKGREDKQTARTNRQQKMRTKTKYRKPKKNHPAPTLFPFDFLHRLLPRHTSPTPPPSPPKTSPSP